jgi:ABC-type branched-subunit amino acid transport system substrate-binding protein
MYVILQSFLGGLTMRKRGVTKIAVVLIMLIALTTSIYAQGEKDGSQPIKVGHLTYHTGAFADVGPWFDAMTEFSLEIINEDPPLGREFVAVHQDIGTIGEAQAARKLIEQDRVDILFCAAHEYLSYRDWMLDYVKANDAPLMPSIHGGGIQRQYGGTTEEPIMRGAPMDSGQAVAAVLKAKDIGAKRVVIVATEIEGSQLQLESALAAADAIGLNVVDHFSVVPEKNSYRNEIQRISGSNPDSILFFSQAQDGGTLVKQSAEAGLSLYVIGTTEWLGQAFPETAGEAALNSHKAVWISGFTYVDGPAWAWYEPRLRNSEYAEVVGDPANSYNIQYTDTLIITALAVEQAGSLKASEWVPAMRSVAMAPGKKVSSYAEGLAAIRAGEEIDYEGLTGSFDYTETGVVSGLFGIFEWQDGNLVQVDQIDDVEVLKYDTL